MAESTKSASRLKLPFNIKIEPRLEDPPKWFSPMLSLLAVGVALLIGALVIWLGGGNPWKAYSHIARYSFGSVGVLSDTLVKAIPLMLVGLACALAFRMKLWNIGAEAVLFRGIWRQHDRFIASFTRRCPSVVVYHHDGLIWDGVWGVVGVHPWVFKGQI